MANIQNRKDNQEYYSIDLVHIFRFLRAKIWVIVSSGVLAAVAGFLIAALLITPMYASSIMLYVNNSAFSVGTEFSISSSEISAAQSLVKTYVVMLQNRTTLEKVIETAEVTYTFEELERMIEASSVNGTEVMQVTVTSADPYEAAKIANAIAEVLPRRISEIIEGSSMEVVDSGAVDLQKVSPSITVYTAVGLFAGVMLSACVLCLMAFLDDTIPDEDYILKNYDYPILARIPDLTESGAKPYGYYYQKSKPSAGK